jgi:diguanylate cyclase (GGDEF)-like protein
MSGAPKYANENERLRALASYEILDTPPDAAFDRLARLAGALFGTPIAVVSLVDGERVWFKAKIGLDTDEAAREHAFFADAMLGSDVVVVEDAAQDSRLADNPLVTGTPNIRFCAGAALVDRDGCALGTLCVMDAAPRSLGIDDRRLLQDLAAMVVDAMELHRSRRQLARKNTELDRANNNLRVVSQQLEAVTAIDGLTGIANRRALDQQIDREMRRAARKRAPVSLLLVDADNLRKYNEQYGHQAGDKCLQAIAGALRAVLHRPADFAARYGGEEFAVLLPDTDAMGALQMAEIVREEIEALRIPHATNANGIVTVSVGACSIVPDIGEGPAALTAPADEALYRAKEQGRNQTCASEQTALAARAASLPHVTRH